MLGHFGVAIGHRDGILNFHADLAPLKNMAQWLNGARHDISNTLGTSAQFEVAGLGPNRPSGLVDPLVHPIHFLLDDAEHLALLCSVARPLG